MKILSGKWRQPAPFNLVYRDNFFSSFSLPRNWLAVIAVESAVKYSFVQKCIQMRQNGQYKAELALSPRLYVKALITTITAIDSWTVPVIKIVGGEIKIFLRGRGQGTGTTESRPPLNFTCSSSYMYSNRCITKLVNSITHQVKTKKVSIPGLISIDFDDFTS